MNDRSTLLLEHHLKELKLPSFLREYGRMAAHCAAEGVDHPQYLLRLAELELIDRHQRMVERRIRAARFPAANTSNVGRTSSPSATVAPVRPTSPWDWAWPPARMGCPWASPPPPPWSTS